MLIVKDDHYYPLPSAEIDEDNVEVEIVGLSNDKASDREPVISQKDRIEMLLSSAGHEPPKSSKTKQNITLKGR